MDTTARRSLPGSIRPVTTTPLPCQRRPDIFGQPLLENPPSGTPGLPFQTRRGKALALAARQLCSSCPLWAECLRDSVVRSDPGGYAAATTRQDRRWIRRRLEIGDSQGRLTSPADPPYRTVELDDIRDAFDALQEHGKRRPGHPAVEAVVAPRHNTAQRFAAHGQQRDNTNEVSTMAPPAGERISFSLGDPALAIQKTVLGPLAHATLVTLRVSEQLAGMLVNTPSAGLTPQLVLALGQTRQCLETWRSATGDDTAYRPADSGLTGSVSIELATSDPVAALRQDILEPLLRTLADSLQRVEAITGVLISAPDGTSPGGLPHGEELEAVRTAVRELGSQLEQYDAPAPRGQDHAGPYEVPQSDAHLRPSAPGAFGSVVPLRSWTTPSLRRAVETAVASFPGPFTGRDVVQALPPGAYEDSAKSVSNALSAMAKSGRLRRISRGTYTANLPSAGALASNS